MTMKLYDFPLSGHAHRARLFASLVGAAVALVHVDLPAGAHKTDEFLEKNSAGQVPVLEDGNVFIADSNAILVYLATKLNATTWLPREPEAAAKVQRWLSVAAGDIAFGPASARLITLFGAQFNPDEVLVRSTRVLTLINTELVEQPYITGDTVTIADIALYSYIASAPEGNVDLAPFKNVLAWLARIEALPGFIEFPQSNVGLRAAS